MEIDQEIRLAIIRVKAPQAPQGVKMRMFHYSLTNMMKEVKEGRKRGRQSI